jgi:hypothetical protein
MLRRENGSVSVLIADMALLRSDLRFGSPIIEPFVVLLITWLLRFYMEEMATISKQTFGLWVFYGKFSCYQTLAIQDELH